MVVTEMYRSRINHQIKCILDGSCLDEIIRRRHLATCIIQKDFLGLDFSLMNSPIAGLYSSSQFFFFFTSDFYLEAKPFARAL